MDAGSPLVVRTPGGSAKVDDSRFAAKVAHLSRSFPDAGEEEVAAALLHADYHPNDAKQARFPSQTPQLKRHVMPCDAGLLRSCTMMQAGTCQCVVKPAECTAHDRSFTMTRKAYSHSIYKCVCAVSCVC